MMLLRLAEVLTFRISFVFSLGGANCPLATEWLVVRCFPVTSFSLPCAGTLEAGRMSRSKGASEGCLNCGRG